LFFSTVLLQLERRFIEIAPFSVTLLPIIRFPSEPSRQIPQSLASLASFLQISFSFMVLFWLLKRTIPFELSSTVLFSKRFPLEFPRLIPSVLFLTWLSLIRLLLETTFMPASFDLSTLNPDSSTPSEKIVTALPLRPASMTGSPWPLRATAFVMFRLSL